MEPLMPSEVARLVFGYLKKERFDELSENFLKSSPHLTECYQMYKCKGSFNTKVNGFDMYDLFDVFGTMCRIINERVPETYESKTMVERLLLLISMNNLPNKDNKSVETQTELNMVDKSVSNIICTEDKNTQTIIPIEPKKNATEIFEIPSFSDIVSDNVTKTTVIETSNIEITTINENKPFVNSSPSSSLKLQLINNNKSIQIGNASVSPKLQMDKKISSTPTKAVYERKHFSQSSPIMIDSYQFLSIQPECQHIPEATSLESMPGLSKEDDPKDNSVIIDTGELVDTFLSDKSLLEKFADTINKSIEAQREIDQIQDGNILDPPTLEKAIDSTQSEPQIKNVLDEFLVFNADNIHNNKNINPDDQQNSIKSRLRNAKKADNITTSKQKKNNLVNLKHNVHVNEDPVADNILLLCENNLSTAVFENYNLSADQFILEQTDCNINKSHNSEIIKIDSEAEEEIGVKTNYRKIAPKTNSILKTNSVVRKRTLPKRKRRIIDEPGVKSQFRKKNIIIHRPKSVHPPNPSIIIEVPSQSSFETISETDKYSDSLPEVSKVASEGKCINKDATDHDTPGDRLKPPKNKSLSTPRRMNTHIRTLDFSTPQPKNNARDQARSKLFFDTPNRMDKIVEESVSSPLPKLQCNWGSVNGFEAIVKKDTVKNWDSDIREMVGAGILTSDADGRKTRKKKTPRKKMKPVNNTKSSDKVSEEKNKLENSIYTLNVNDEINKSNISESSCGSNKQTSNVLSSECQNLPKEFPSDNTVPLETQDKVTKHCNEQSTDSSPSKSFNDKESHTLLETSNKISKMTSEQPLIESGTLKNVNDKVSPTQLETPNKILKMTSGQPLIESGTLKNFSDENLTPKPSIFAIPFETPKIDNCKELPSNAFSISFDTPAKVTDLCNKSPIEFSPNETQNKNKQTKISINELEYNLNQSNTSTVPNKLTISGSKTLSELSNKSQENEVNSLEGFNNHKYHKPLQLSTKQSDKSTENVVKQSLELIKTTNSNEFNSPESIKVKYNIETPVKCDESAVDIPETPISKLLREFDHSKCITPLQSTPVHYEDSLTETPISKIFRETSHLNRPQISPIPPTPGNSMSFDTLIVPPEIEVSKLSSQLNSILNKETKTIAKQPIQVTLNDKDTILGDHTKEKKTKVKSKSLETKKTKIKSNLNVKKKKVYNLFGSEMSSSSSADELETSKVQLNTIVINKTQHENDRTSGFKPIPKRKSIITASSAFNNIKKPTLDKTNSELYKSSTKSPVMQSKKSSMKETKKILNTTQSKKCMVHFDDPVEQYRVSPIKSTPCNSNNNKNVSQTENTTLINHNSDQLVEISKCLKTPSTLYEQTKSTKSPVKKLKCSNSFAEVCIADVSMEKKSTSCILSNTTKMYDTTNKKHKPTGICANNQSNKVESLEKITNFSFSSISSTNKNNNVTQTSENYISGKDENCKKEDATLNKINQSKTTFIDKSVNDTSFVSIIRDDESFQLMKDTLTKDTDTLIDETINQSLKQIYAFEIINDDDSTENGSNQMVYLRVSEVFTFIDMISESNDIQHSTCISSSSKNNKVVSPVKLETGELVESDDKIQPVTSTPKTIPEKKNDEKQKHRSRNNDRDDKYDKKYRPNKSRDPDKLTQFDCRNRFNKSHVKREYCRDSFRENIRFQPKEYKKRSYRDSNRDDDRRGRDWLDVPERSSTGQRMYKVEDTKKATKRPAERSDHNKTPSKVSKVEHQRLLKNVNVDHFLSVVHGRK